MKRDYSAFPGMRSSVLDLLLWMRASPPRPGSRKGQPNGGKTYKPNGKRECERRMRQMAKRAAA